MSDYNERQANRVVGSVIASAFSNITDSIVDTHSAVKVLAISVTAELAVFAIRFFAAEKLAESVGEKGDNFWVYGLIAVFVNGFLIAFALYRLIANKWPHAGANLFIWIISSVAGTFNVLLIYALVVG